MFTFLCWNLTITTGLKPVFGRWTYACTVFLDILSVALYIVMPLYLFIGNIVGG